MNPPVCNHSMYISSGTQLPSFPTATLLKQPNRRIPKYTPHAHPP
jgi:hypothetical protein